MGSVETVINKLTSNIYALEMAIALGVAVAVTIGSLIYVLVTGGQDKVTLAKRVVIDNLLIVVLITTAFMFFTAIWQSSGGGGNGGFQ